MSLLSVILLDFSIQLFGFIVSFSHCFPPYRCVSPFLQHLTSFNFYISLIEVRKPLGLPSFLLLPLFPFISLQLYDLVNIAAVLHTEVFYDLTGSLTYLILTFVTFSFHGKIRYGLSNTINFVPHTPLDLPFFSSLLLLPPFPFLLSLPSSFKRSVSTKFKLMLVSL